MARILVVDDLPDSVRIIGMMLRAEHQIVGVASPADALHAMTRGGFDLIIADQNMPGMTGEALLTRVGMLWPKTARLMLTADPRQRNGEQPYLVMHKPFKIAELRDAITKLMTRAAPVAATPPPVDPSRTRR